MHWCVLLLTFLFFNNLSESHQATGPFDDLSSVSNSDDPIGDSAYRATNQPSNALLRNLNKVVLSERSPLSPLFSVDSSNYNKETTIGEYYANRMTSNDPLPELMRNGQLPKIPWVSNALRRKPVHKNQINLLNLAKIIQPLRLRKVLV